MRLQEMYYLICNAIENWVEPQFTEHKSDYKQDIIYSCDNAQAIVRLLEPLRILPSVNEEIDVIFSCSKRFALDPRPYILPKNVDPIRIHMRSIKDNLRAMVDMCETLGVEPHSDGFDVKLPTNITLEELADCTKDLSTIFAQCPLLQHEDGQISLQGVDVGSSWLTFIIRGTGLSVILQNLASLVDKVVHIRSHWLTCKQQEEECKKLGIANEVLEGMVTAHNAVLKKVQENIVEELSAQNNVTEPEDKARLNYSIDLMHKMMDKGLEIYAAIGSADEVKAAFPAVEKQTLPEGLPKLLESAEETDKTE